MNELTAALKEELNVDTAFTLPIFGGIEIQASGKLSPEQVQTILNAWNAFAGGDAHAIH